jgi:hypothetical protein
MEVRELFFLEGEGGKKEEKDDDRMNKRWKGNTGERREGYKNKKEM